MKENTEPDRRNMEKLKALNEKEKKQNKMKLPKWAWSPDGIKVKTKPESLGSVILKESHYLYIQNKDKYDLYQYETEKGYWQLIGEQAIKYLITSKLKSVNAWTARTNSDTFKFIKDSIEIKSPLQTINKIYPRYFNFKNGVYDFKTNQLLPHSPDYYFTSCTDYALNLNDDETPETNSWLHYSLGDAKKLVMEYIGYAFYRSYEPIQGFLILQGAGGDGKTTFINYVNSLFDHNDVSSVSLTDLAKADNNFDLSELYLKALNSYPDISKSIIQDTAQIKALTGNDLIDARVKNKPRLHNRFFAKLLFGANALPDFKDTSEGFSRRINLANWQKINNFNRDFDTNKIKAERGAFVYHCIQLAKQAMKRGYFSNTDETTELRKNWVKANDHVQEFIEEYCITGEDYQEKKTYLYSGYRSFCFDNGYKALSNQKFKQELANKGYFEKNTYINGVRTRAYAGIRLKPSVDITNNDKVTRLK